MLFNFKLTPLGQVKPWGDQRLHWYGLTDGQYWLEAGDHILLEYTEHARSHSLSTRFCDYLVVRLYEDLLEILPFVLETMPDELIPYFSGDSGKAWERKSADWFSSNMDAHLDADEFWEIADISATWIGSRILDTGYLNPSFPIRMRSDMGSVYIEWDSRDKLINGQLAWTATCGQYRIPREVFITEVHAFHTALMEQMAMRIDQVLAGALPKEIQIDLPGLQHEQAMRSADIKRALSGPIVPTNWDAVLESVRKIECGAYDCRRSIQDGSINLAERNK